jgi:hypothetical protein
MAIALVQDDYIDSATGDPLSAAFTTANASGNLLTCVVSFTSNARSVVGITDTNGNTWSLVKRIAASGAAGALEIWAAPNCGAGANTLSVNLNASTTVIFHLQEWSGAALAAPADQSDSIELTSATTHTTGGIAVTAGQLVICGWRFSAAFTVSAAPADYTALDTAHSRGLCYYRVEPSDAAIDPTLTTTVSIDDSIGIVAAFKVAGAAAPTSRASGMMTGYW